MEQFDLLVLALLLAGFVVGTLKGFIKQAVSIVCVIAGIVAGRMLSPLAAQICEKEYSHAAYGIAFALVFLAVIVVGIVISKLTKSLIESVDLGWANRIAGGLLCSFKYLVLLGLVINLAEIVGADKKLFPPKTQEQSVFYTASKKSLGGLMPIFDAVSETTSGLIERSGIKEILEEK